MDIELRNKVNLFYENYDEMKRIFKKDKKFLRIAEALVYGKTYKEFDVDNFQLIRNYFDEKTTDVSEELITIMTLMIQDREDYKNIVKNAIRVYKYIISKGLSEEEKCFYAAFILAKNYNDQELTEKTKKFMAINEKFNGKYYIEYANLVGLDKSLADISYEYNEIVKCIEEASLRDLIDKSGLALALIMQSDPIEKKVEKLLGLLCNYKSEFSQIAPSSCALLGVSTLIIEDSEEFSKELNAIYKIVNERILFKYFLSKEAKINISIAILLEKYIEEVNSDLIELEFKDQFKSLDAVEERVLYTFK